MDGLVWDRKREVRSLLLGYYFASLAFSELPRRVHNAEQALVSLSLASPLGRCEAQKPSEQQATHVPYVLSPYPAYAVSWVPPRTALAAKFSFIVNPLHLL